MVVDSLILLCNINIHSFLYVFFSQRENILSQLLGPLMTSFVDLNDVIEGETA